MTIDMYFWYVGISYFVAITSVFLLLIISYLKYKKIKEK